MENVQRKYQIPLLLNYFLNMEHIKITENRKQRTVEGLRPLRGKEEMEKQVDKIEMKEKEETPASLLC